MVTNFIGKLLTGDGIMLEPGDIGYVNAYDNVEGNEICESTGNGWNCTRDKDHVGKHSAGSYDFKPAVYATWDGADQYDEFPEIVARVDSHGCN